ncbi:hypothetical protein SEA_A3WALLY_346 [Microbacterium phage A3Wally]|nr:hypothetical protein SEA_A3WALLY_346 [Microbacterium phage A3Wally]
MGLNYPLSFALGAATGVGFLPMFQDDEPERTAPTPVEPEEKPERVEDAVERLAMQFAKTYYHRNLWELTHEERMGCRARAERYLGDFRG